METNEITKEQYRKYEAVRSSGITNMWAINTVQELSGLDKETITTIMKGYTELMEKYPEVRQ